ncbi:heme lyase CcmF/NrfE family subunit [Micromonospora terminaliae]|uniref:Cytochrome c biogenesis protein CcsA n=1 Tax=Micromonospora terminaliae TaxID=1914461 RepID=A0AAJ2ZCN0_9ACTN|nr:cytochrome c-type biogenesis CcmF C-terminal domain-containing protein [Micromonospora terminaliae]NES27762.1 cytochrome c biogenesis protein CcsA [Micromonospora terminaliae]QGL47449.1 heme lyase CcmF/NrfE family subunit [Micromonospora terminaliae]
MLGDLGTAGLAVGLACATLTTLLWLRVALFGAAVRTARHGTAATLAAAALACALLETALLRHDFSVRFVAENGGRDVPLYYTLTSLWSALDGSLLLWLLVLGGYAALLARRAYPPRLHAYAMVVLSVVTMFFFALSTFAANPFRAVSPVPADGPGPNPLLQQHPAMGVHPPLLYAGYLGLVVPFAFALAAPLAGRDGPGWVRMARPWALVAWAALTGGIGMGAWWSYAVLGWGGYWAWDPVENASLLPWLTATAFLHTTLVRGRVAWHGALACASFLLVLLGTFLTRSGAVASVHAFTDSPLGPMLLGFVLLAVVVSAVLTGRRAPEPAPTERPRALSRATLVLVHAVLLVTIAAVVLIGTILPLLTTPLTGSGSSVGPAYYQRTAVPLAVVVLLVMGVTPALRVRDRSAALWRLVVPAGAGLGTVALVGLLSRPGPAALTAFGAAGFVLTGLAGDLAPRLRRPGPHRRPARLAGLVAHAGLALVAAGVAGSSAYGRDTERTLRVGETLRVSDVAVRLVGVDRTGGDGNMAVRARLVLTASGHERTIRPALRYQAARDTAVTVPAIGAGPLRDTYVTLLAVAEDSGTATVRLAVNPLVGLIWVGGALTAVSGLLAAAATARSRTRPAARADRPRPAPVAVGPGAPT